MTRGEAIAYVADLMRGSRLRLLSPEYKDAMDLSVRFDIRVSEVLEFVKNGAKRA